MSNFDEKPTFIHENRRLEEAHDKAMEKVTQFWHRKYGNGAGTLLEPMYVKCSNGDEILCEEAQEMFNYEYELNLRSEMHL